MPGTDGSTTPTQESYDASHPRRESAGERRKFIQAHRNVITNHIKIFAPNGPSSLMGSITAPAPDLLTVARQNHLVSWAGTENDDQQRVSICLLNDPSAVATRDTAVKFFKDYRDPPTVDTAQPWVKYGEDLATLADLMSRQENERTGVSFVPASQPPSEIQTREDLGKLNEIIVGLEVRVEDVMFVDNTDP